MIGWVLVAVEAEVRLAGTTNLAPINAPQPNAHVQVILALLSR